MMIIGIDPGFAGGIAILTSKREEVYPMPLEQVKMASGKLIKRIHASELANILKQYKNANNDCIIALERVSAMKGQGVTGMFRFGEGYGVIQGIAASLEIPVVYVSPVTWKRHHNLLKTEKTHSRQLAEKLSGMSFSRKKDEGPAEAYLVAKWLRDTIPSTPSTNDE